MEKLNADQLACGYTQRWTCEHGNKPIRLRNVTLQLWMEHGAYHVRAHDHGKIGRIFWDSFRTLTEARKRYSTAKRELRENPDLPEDWSALMRQGLR